MGRSRALALFLVLGLCAGARAQSDAAAPAPANAPKPYIPIRPLNPGQDQNAGEEEANPSLDVIDAPTAATLDQGSFYSRSRFYSAGGILQYLSFGVFDGLNIGASVSLDSLIGRQSPIRVRAPEAQIKYRFYDGGRFVPAMAVGYDGQGYDYDQITKNYNENRRGIYWVASQELGIPGLEVHPSVNLSDFNSSSFGGAIPITYTYQDRVAAMLEWDNINSLMSQSRLNAGVRFFVTPALHIDFAVRGIGQSGRFPDGTHRGTERVIQLVYTGSF
ncbi:MAG TPA: hypothetical protein VNH15_00930 [Elusimicrobiota bacterium]|nr:hypothetical protein [Elusimicrobiota bacterium]